MTGFDALCITLGGLAVVLTAVPIALALRFRRYVLRQLARPRHGYAPKVSIILPCKGVDPGFEENMQAVFDQDYPNFEIIFSTATDDDEAGPVLRRLIARNPHRPARLVHSGLPATCSQKLNNQLHALRQIAADAEVLVFLDSDGRLRRDFLRDLVDPLGDESIGVTTGYRWYMPVVGGFGSWLRTTWNGGGYPFLVSPRSTYAWSGAMALRRETFEHARVAEQWQHAITDEFTLTNAVKALGKSVYFVPACIAISHEDSTLADTLAWTNRQTVLMRVYHPHAWQSIFIAHALGVALPVVGAGLLIAAATEAWPIASIPGVVAFLLLSLLLQGPLNAMLLLPVLRRMMPDDAANALTRHAAKMCAAAPFASLLILINSIHSCATRRITWRGVQYEIRSPTDVRIIRTPQVQAASA